MAASKIKFKILTDKFPDLLSKLEDLTKIDDNIKLKIDKDDILMYSMVGDSSILAFKSYIVKTSEYLGFEDFDFTLDVIIPSAKKFVRNLSFLKGDKIVLEVTYKESDDSSTCYSRNLVFNGGKLKVQLIPGEEREMRDITKEQLDSRLNLKNKKWSFAIERGEFNDIKRLASNNSDGRILAVTVVGGRITMSENHVWELEVGETGSKNSSLMFNKSFLSSINDGSTPVEFNMFETFILIKDDNSNLMISFECDFSNE